jgi:hypothetical protein
MSKRNLGFGAGLAALLVMGIWSGIGSAGWLATDNDAIAFTAALTAGKEVPRPTGAKPGAGGAFAAGLTKSASGGRLAWRLTFHGLTGKAIAAHVHFGKAGKAGPVAVALCGPCRSGQRGTATINARVVSALSRGLAYVNVHTPKNAAGEIRGQVRKGGKVVGPPPTTDTTTTTTYVPPPYP